MSDELDYSRIRWNIEDIPEHENVIEKFKDLMACGHVFMDEDNLPQDVNPDKVLRFLILMYSPNTPIRDIPDQRRRKQYVLNKLNLIDGESVSTGYKQMCEMQEPWIVSRFLTFTRLFSNLEYRSIAVCEERMTKLEEFMMTSSIDKATDDTNLSKGRAALRAEIQESINTITQHENSQLAKEMVMFSVVQQNMGLSPEDAVYLFSQDKFPTPKRL